MCKLVEHRKALENLPHRCFLILRCILRILVNYVTNQRSDGQEIFTSVCAVMLVTTTNALIR